MTTVTIVVLNFYLKKNFSPLFTGSDCAVQTVQTNCESKGGAGRRDVFGWVSSCILSNKIIWGGAKIAAAHT